MIPAARQRLVLWCVLACAVTWIDDARACTITSTTTIELDSFTSFDATSAQPDVGFGSSGLTCSTILGLLSSQHIFLTVDSMSAGLIHPDTGDSIPFHVATVPGGTPVVPGTTSQNLAAAGLLSLGSVAGEIQLFISLGAAGNIASGRYTGTVTLRWHYAVCSSLGVGGACVGSWTRSPGIDETCVLPLCTITPATLPGSGEAVHITISVDVTPDCRFDVDDIDFSGAPFVESFEPVTGSLRITCTKGMTYSVGLSEGNFSANGRRRMGSGSNRLEYDVFLPGGVRWDNLANRALQNLPAQGNLPELFVYEARIYPDQGTPPLGHYQDTLIVDVAF